jgi:ligand-binding sensor domain-containing protein
MKSPGQIWSWHGHLAGWFCGLLFAGLFLAGFVTEVFALEHSQPLNQYALRHWGTEHHLPHPNVKAVVQTPDGYIWAGTEQGLARFNGETFTPIYTNSSGDFHRLRVNCLLVQSNGTLWIGGNGNGLGCLQAGKLTQYSTAQGMPSRVVKALHEDRQGRIWIVTPKQLALVEGTQVRVLTNNFSPPIRTLNCIIEDHEGKLWVGTDKGLYGPVDERSPIIQPFSIAGNKFITVCISDGDRGFWIGTDNGLFHYHDQGRLDNFFKPQGLRSNRILALSLDQQGTLWVGTPAGISRIRNSTVIIESVPPNLEHVEINGFLEDREKSLWIASGLKLIQLNDRPFYTYSGRNGLNPETVLTICERTPGSFLLGTADTGVYEFQENKVLQKIPKITSTTINTILPGRNGTLWAGTRSKGLDFFDAVTPHNYTTKSGLLDNNVSALHEDPQGTVWIGTRKGLNRYQAKALTNVTLPNSSTQAMSIRCIYSTRNGDLWVGSSHGLYSLNQTRTNHYTMANGLPSDLVYTVHEDQQDRLWVGTAHGLANLQNGQWQVKTGNPKLDLEHIFWLTTDQQGNLWGSTPKGPFRVAIADITNHWKNAQQPVSVRFFDYSDGLLSVECLGGRQPVACRSADGRLWFLTQRGMAVIHPAHAAKNPVPPPVYIEKITVNGKPYGVTNGMILPAGSRQINFIYAGLSYAASGWVHYRYRLEGVDTDWVEAEGRREANYGNLDPGEHKFKVVASNQDGVWSSQSATLAFTITPYFHETGWFYGAVTLVVLGLSVGAYRGRMHLLRQQKEQLERLVAQRSRQLEQQMAERLKLETQLSQAQKMEAVGTLAAGVAHYFNNLLTVIQMNASLLRDEKMTEKDMQESVDYIHKATEHAADLVRQLVAFSRRHWLQLAPLDLNAVIQDHIKTLSGSPAQKIKIQTSLLLICRAYPPTARESNRY